MASGNINGESVDRGGGGVCFRRELARKQQPKVSREEWISKETWQLANWRAELQRAGRESTREVYKVLSDFQQVLQEYIRQRVQAAGSNIEVFLEAVTVKEACDHLTRWLVKRRGNRPTPPWRSWTKSWRIGRNSIDAGHW